MDRSLLSNRDLVTALLFDCFRSCRQNVCTILLFEKLRQKNDENHIND
jgi:hypothetical protein